MERVIRCGSLLNSSARSASFVTSPWNQRSQNWRRVKHCSLLRHFKFEYDRTWCQFETDRLRSVKHSLELAKTVGNSCHDNWLPTTSLWVYGLPISRTESSTKGWCTINFKVLGVRVGKSVVYLVVQPKDLWHKQQTSFTVSFLLEDKYVRSWSQKWAGSVPSGPSTSSRPMWALIWRNVVSYSAWKWVESLPFTLCFCSSDSLASGSSGSRESRLGREPTSRMRRARNSKQWSCSLLGRRSPSHSRLPLLAVSIVPLYARAILKSHTTWSDKTSRPRPFLHKWPQQL